MRTPHKHADLIKAWADGAEIEHRDSDTDPWSLTLAPPCWDLNTEYRIKLEPKVIRYRVALIGLIGAGDPYVIVVTNGLRERHPDFIRWLGDWQEVEV